MDVSRISDRSAKEHQVPDNQFWRDASGRLTFEMFRVSIADYPAVCAALVSAFGLVPTTALVTNGCDILFQDYRRGEEVVGLAWDNWTGYTVVAKVAASESLVREIAAWLLGSRWATVPNPAASIAAIDRPRE
jgi:hypothetical protein